MRRRQALRHLGVGFSSALVGPAFLASCKKDDPAPEVQYDGNIIIIGAGAAGLYTADILHSKGLSVKVLEASNQIGGRIQSLRNQQGLPYQSIADFPVELGAEYWQGADSVLGKLVSNLGLPAVGVPFDSRRYVLDGAVKSAADWAGNADFEYVEAFMNNIENYSASAVSMRAAAGGLSANAEALLNAQAGNFFGSSADNVGIKPVSEDMKLNSHDQEYYVLRNNTFQDLMISRFQRIYDLVQVNAPVKSIDYSGDVIKVTLEDGTEMTATKVIVTVPITILKNGITFSPALPAAKTSALNSLGMDPSIRVVLDFKKNFWGEQDSLIFGGEVVPQYFSSGVNRSELNQTLTITVNGPKALELSNAGDDLAIVNKVLAELDTLYAGQASQFIRKTLPPAEPKPDDPPFEEKMIYFVKDWTKEKYIGGGFSYPMAGTTIDDRIALGEPIGLKMFFAGEATDVTGEPGTVNGALASAERVAEDVVLSIKKVS